MIGITRNMLKNWCSGKLKTNWIQVLRYGTLLYKPHRFEPAELQSSFVWMKKLANYNTGCKIESCSMAVATINMRYFEITYLSFSLHLVENLALQVIAVRPWKAAWYGHGCMHISQCTVFDSTRYYRCFL